MIKRQKNNQEIGHRIKFYRLKLGLTQQLLAKKINVAQGQISDYEAGKVAVPLELLCHISDLLDVPVTVLDETLLNIPFFRKNLQPKEFGDTEALEAFRRRLLDTIMESDLQPSCKNEVYKMIKDIPVHE